MMNFIKKLVMNFLNKVRGVFRRKEGSSIDPVTQKKKMISPEKIVKLGEQAINRLQVMIITSAESIQEAKNYQEAIEKLEATEFGRMDFISPNEVKELFATYYGRVFEKGLAEVARKNAYTKRMIFATMLNNCMHASKINRSTSALRIDEYVEHMCNKIMDKQIDSMEIYFETEKTLEMYHLAWKCNANGEVTNPLISINASLATEPMTDRANQAVFVEAFPLSLMKDIFSNKPSYALVTIWANDGKADTHVIIDPENVIDEDERFRGCDYSKDFM